MKIIIQDDHTNTWDTIVWDDKAVAEVTDARGLLCKMVAQSILEWAETAQLEAKVKASRASRCEAQVEVMTEAERIARGETDDVPY